MSDAIIHSAVEANRLAQEATDLEQIQDCIRSALKLVEAYPSASSAGRKDFRAELGRLESQLAAALDGIGDPFRPVGPPSDWQWFPRLGVAITPDGTGLAVAPDWFHQVELLLARLDRRHAAFHRDAGTIKLLLAPYVAEEGRANGDGGGRDEEFGPTYVKAFMALPVGKKNARKGTSVASAVPDLAPSTLRKRWRTLLIAGHVFQDEQDHYYRKAKSPPWLES